MSKEQYDKKPLITHTYTADPSAHAFEKDGKKRIYIYPSHDRDIDIIDNDNGDQYDMVDYHVFSLEKPFEKPVDHGPAFTIDDVPWASKQLWAPDCCYKNGKYYFYFPARDKDGLFRIGVAVGTNPEGPFKPEKNYIEKTFSIDPCSFIDDDGSAYLYYGGIWGGQLQNWVSGSFDPAGEEPDGDVEALKPLVAKLNDDMLSVEDPKYIDIVDEKGQTLRAKDKERRYFEGPWMHKYKGKYYFSYSTGDTHNLVYAVGDSPYGPFTYKGRILPPVLGWTTHHSIMEFEGRWFLFYHDCTLSNGVNHKRNVKMTELFYDDEGNILPVEPV